MVDPMEKVAYLRGVDDVDSGNRHSREGLRQGCDDGGCILWGEGPARAALQLANTHMLAYGFLLERPVPLMATTPVPGLVTNLRPRSLPAALYTRAAQPKPETPVMFRNCF